MMPYRRTNSIGGRDWKVSAIEIVCVSGWHQWQAGEMFGPDIPVSHIYNPVDDALYKPSGHHACNPFKLVWLASPHKGLEGALEAVRAAAPRGRVFPLNLASGSPGYWQIDQHLPPRVRLCTDLFAAWAELMDEIADALCVLSSFCAWPETFGLIAAEANCLGSAGGGHRYAGLVETAQGGEISPRARR